MFLDLHLWASKASTLQSEHMTDIDFFLCSQWHKAFSPFMFSSLFVKLQTLDLLFSSLTHVQHVKLLQQHVFLSYYSDVLSLKMQRTSACNTSSKDHVLRRYVCVYYSVINWMRRRHVLWWCYAALVNETWHPMVPDIKHDILLYIR